MAQQQLTSVENNFTKGLITESTGLNFPENGATEADNCEFTLIGNVNRRLGIDYEDNYEITPFGSAGYATQTYKWNNAGGDGQSQLIVVQVGPSLFFYLSSAASKDHPVSTHRLPNGVGLSSFAATGGTFDPTVDAQFSDGNGYLFVYHPNCDPFYVTYDPNTQALTSNVIYVQIRDQSGISYLEGSVSNRPVASNGVHSYNLQNQGWTSGPTWVANYSDTFHVALGSHAFTVPSGLVGITNGTAVLITSLTAPFVIPSGAQIASGTVTSYAGTTLTVNIGTIYGSYTGFDSTSGFVSPVNVGNITTFKSVIGVYPSNADVWWYFKNSSGVFDPATTAGNITYASGPAPKGTYILNAFRQDRSVVSGVPFLATMFTSKRPSTGTWFQGRVWYAGVNDGISAVGTAPNYSWTENIYFSQVVTDASQFGYCYQQNDPTSEQLFDLLPTDGGTIQIQGSGAIYKLFPIQNGLLVFAANGVWFITGSTGIGFTATDYTITKISSVASISNTSFVDVQGLPYFWNEEGIYRAEPQQGGGLAVNPITIGTILSFYNDIPLRSKLFVKAAYHPIDYVIQWVYSSTDSGDEHQYDRILNYNVFNKAFFPYSVNIERTSINGVIYVQGPGGSTSPEPVFKYLVSNNTLPSPQGITFGEAWGEAYVDWNSTGFPKDYTSYFVTGYKLRGQAIKRFQPVYIQVYSQVNGEASAYVLQGLWDYANDRNSNRWSTQQLVTNNLTRFGTVMNRRKIRGHGYAVQFKFTSVSGMPFDIVGWAVQDSVNTGL